MFKFLFIPVCGLLFPVISSSPINEENSILKYENYRNIEDGIYNFNYELSDGSTREENIRIVNQINDKNGKDEAPVISGQYSYKSNEGYQIYVRYQADNKGFKTSKFEFGKNVKIIKKPEPIFETKHPLFLPPTIYTTSPRPTTTYRTTTTYSPTTTTRPPPPRTTRRPTTEKLVASLLG